MTRAEREERDGYLFVSPWMAGFLLFILYPLLASLYYAFCDYSVLRRPIWTGLDNFTTLFHDKVFWTSLYNTAYFAVFFLPASLVLSLALAMLLNAKVRGQAIYRTIFYLPSLLPLVATAVLFLWVFDGDNGVVNNLLKLGGFQGPGWLSDPAWTKFTIILLSLWGVGNTMIIYLASLQEVPESLYEAAELDGARAWERLKAVTLPMISPVILFNTLMGIIGALQVFTVPFVMFPGGQPADSTYFYTAYLYDNAFKYHNMGYACAMGWVMFLIILVLTLISRQLSEKHVYYGGG
ncbi:MAG: sugar ABC transporter permease [Fimbriimonas sp.]|nr:sugar ABC transporter permease [Fimbriimonas sp.]